MREAVPVMMIEPLSLIVRLLIENPASVVYLEAGWFVLQVKLFEVCALMGEMDLVAF